MQNHQIIFLNAAIIFLQLLFKQHLNKKTPIKIKIKHTIYYALKLINQSNKIKEKNKTT